MNADINHSNSKPAQKGTVVLAAGGTGGHIFPAQALAEAVKAQGLRAVLITDRRFARFAEEMEGLEVKVIRSGSLSGGMLQRVLKLGNIFIGILQARRLLKQLKPVAVVGFGGYPSFPTMLAACQLKCYTVIHEQNSVLGRANRFLAKYVSVIATSFDRISHVPENAQDKIIFTGNPVRRAIRSLHDVPYPTLSADGKMHLLVMGGSLGATVFSKVVPDALRLLPAALRSRLWVDQQCRAADIEAVREAYDELNINANLATFFGDVPARLASAHLTITRAGASTVAEVLTAGRPAILVPYPAAMDDHQTFNANTVEDAGGGWLMPQDGFTPKALSSKIEHFLNLPSTLEEAAKHARAAGHPDAAERLAELVLRPQKNLSHPEDAIATHLKNQDYAA